ncbi:Hypp4555 [Branchiostoma lanceolatum]|uniref:Hypp4555 protein n=1 Tax=Branchiostoma lanceolatum TaxID=7740 RepID=A0A8K0AAX6_BRALA|nr:Hypp4555 [Branchiostoma lanceolatum]
MVALGSYVVLVVVFLRPSLCFLTEEEILRRVETNVNSPPVNNTRLTTHLIARYQAWWHECSQETNPCQNGGVCTRKVLKGSEVERPPCAPMCVCPMGYSGRHCDKCDWHQVFATERGTGQAVLDAWTAGPDAEVLHEKSLLVEEWATLGIKKVKVVLETSEGEDVEVVFNGENTDKLSWFSKSRLISSPWTDLPGETTNFFSIEGLSHERCRRSFFISHDYNGCPGDTGWMAVVEHGPDAICEWERVPSVELPGILYSNASTYVRWSDESQLGRANRMVIYIKMCR